MKFKTLRSKLLLGILIASMVPYVFGGIYLWNNVESWIIKNHESNAQVLVEQIGDFVDHGLVEDMENVVEMISKDDRIHIANGYISNYQDYNTGSEFPVISPEELIIEDYFSSIYESHHNINFIFFATVEGGYMEYPRFAPDQPYDPLTREWFVNTIGTDDMVLSNPYKTQITNEMVMSFTKMIQNDGQTIGVIGLSVKIDSVMHNLNEITVGNEGYIMVMNQNDQIIVSPYNEQWLYKTPTELGLSPLMNLKDEKVQSNRGVLTEEEKFLHVYTSPSSGWKVVSVIAMKDLLEDSSSLFGILALIYTIMLIGIYLLIFYITKRIMNPIKDISEALDQVGKFDYSDGINKKMMKLSYNDDEIGVIASSLVDMQLEIELYMERLQATNREVFEKNQMLTSSEEELRAQLEEIEQQRNHIDHLAFHDPLTELPNRRKFAEKLESALVSSQKGAVIMLDLDNFKSINDTLGHVFGDKLLKAVSARMEMIVNDKTFISRFGGDEFLILMINDDLEKTIVPFIHMLQHLFDDPFDIDLHSIEIHFSIGISMFPKDSEKIDELIMYSDLALYAIKNNGKNSYGFYDDSLMNKVKLRIEIEHELKEALEKNAFRVVYQPQYNLTTNRIECFEALLRLDSGLYGPNEFIPVAEENGLIVPIGRLVVKLVVEQISKWRLEGRKIKPVAINFSAAQLHDSGFVEFLEETLSSNGVSSDLIEIEITESLFVENEEVTHTFIQNIKRIGIKIAIDDFGTGYSSLSYLTYLPIDKIKLDRALSDRFLTDEHQSVVENIIALSHSLGLIVVAEGIEEKHHYEILKAYKCDCIQGYYFSKPLEKDDINWNENHY
ncbi:MAG: EAL domain-containing protein [Clostridiales bacterium]|nr:EAL domain-containing protein [Clostridiales bacterium]